MPWYDWKCPQCEKNTRVIHSVADYDKPPEECEPELEATGEKDESGKSTFKRPASCGYRSNEGWKKQIGGGNFILKGYGWARDGYS